MVSLGKKNDDARDEIVKTAEATPHSDTLTNAACVVASLNPASPQTVVELATHYADDLTRARTDNHDSEAEMLFAQCKVLNSLFMALARTSPHSPDRAAMFAIALKAQSQYRETVVALAKLREKPAPSSAC